MTGDIKGAWLSDTDTTNVVGTELVTNGTFDTDVSGWSSTSTSTLAWLAAGQIEVTGTATTASNQVVTSAAMTTVVGERYVLEFEVVSSNGGNNGIFAPNIAKNNNNGYWYPGVGKHVTDITASSTSTLIHLHAGINVGIVTVFDNVSLRRADSDRSVNNKGLQVNGTITKTAVATGADLVAYSGFSSSNYLEQPYGSHLDFGTGDFSFMCWVKGDGGTSGYTHLINMAENSQGSPGNVQLKLTKSDWLPYLYGQGNQLVASSSAAPSSTWFHLVAGRKGGVFFMYRDGKDVSSSALTSAFDIGNYPVRIGEASTSNEPATGMSMALVRVSATAPTAAQIKEIYEAEKPLFQENAKCTLNGTSDAVQCLAYDDSTELLHVGTSGGRSTFQGLRRVDETATNTTEISAQGGMIIEETA